jgi:deoxyribose-phosphate aldolase
LGSDSRLAVAALIDHTLLKPDATRADIEQLCREALDLGFAAVCINPAWVRLAADRVGRSRVAVCAVIGFPFGANTPDAKAFEARRALFDGARELDMVMNIGALKSGDLGLVRRDIEAVAVPVREAGGLSKVIIEASLLTDEEKIAACTLARAAGADYVKTSTGFGPGGATAADVALMRRTVGPDMGVKAAGGIGSYRAAREMIAAGATRIGSSAGVRIVREAQDASVSQSGSSSY